MLTKFQCPGKGADELLGRDLWDSVFKYLEDRSKNAVQWTFSNWNGYSLLRLPLCKTTWGISPYHHLIICEPASAIPCVKIIMSSLYLWIIRIFIKKNWTRISINYLSQKATECFASASLHISFVQDLPRVFPEQSSQSEPINRKHIGSWYPKDMHISSLISYYKLPKCAVEWYNLGGVDRMWWDWD